MSNEIGKRYGRLVVIGKTDKRYHSTTIYKCRCDCGNIVELAIFDYLPLYILAFDMCYNLQSVYYVGTQEGWNSITIESDNECLTPGSWCSATIYYYSEIEPTTSGYYWHYDTDGITPIVW